MRHALGPAGGVALALPGHAPDAPIIPGGWRANADALADRIAAASGGPCHLIGYSLGARLALDVLLERPDLVVRATLVGGHLGLADAGERAARERADAAWAARLRADGIEAFVSAWEALPLWNSQRAVDPTHLEAQRRIRLAHDPAALADSLDALGLAQMPDARERLSSARATVELVTGGLDAKFGALADEAVALAPHWQHRRVAGVGHNVVLEAPGAVL